VGDDGTMADHLTGPHYGRRRFLAAAGLVGLGTGVGVGVDTLVSSPVPVVVRKQSPVIPHGLVSGRFHSVRRGVGVGWTVSFPPGWKPQDRVPLCLVLHGFDADHTYAFNDLHLQDAQVGLAQGKASRSLVLAAADGGNGYWHPRADGDDPQGMLMDEFLPALRAMGIGTDHVVSFGWSMGGYGALLLAETYPQRIANVGAESPAIWPSFAASQNANPTAFDSAADWSAHNVVGHIATLDATPVRINCGLSDPFLPASRQLATLLKPSAVELTPGGHDLAFWKSHASAQLQFLAS
jgi:S-formylglutathione hydrolase FrmB